MKYFLLAIILLNMILAKKGPEQGQGQGHLKGQGKGHEKSHEEKNQDDCECKEEETNVVCGDDTKWYRNDCEMECHGAVASGDDTICTEEVPDFDHL